MNNKPNQDSTLGTEQEEEGQLAFLGEGVAKQLKNNDSKASKLLPWVLLAAVGSALGVSYMNESKETEQLNDEIRRAVVLDEKNGMGVRKAFVREIQKIAGKEGEDVAFTPISTVVEMTIKSVQEQKNAGDMAIEDFQIRVVSHDLRKLAEVAQKTDMAMSHFLKIVDVYGKDLPAGYSTTSGNGQEVAKGIRHRLDEYLISFGTRQTREKKK